MQLVTNWYFTFGFEQKHSNKYVCFKNSTYDEARTRMFEAFGEMWAFQYSEKEWILESGKTQAEEYGYDEIKV